jgi:MarR family transcriptional regulator, organic hydroperoxide resistance regulator
MDGRGEWPTGRMLSAVARHIEKEWNDHLRAWGLNHASIPVLFFLAGGPRSQRELAASGVTEQTMSRIVSRLERSGYVLRQAHPHDRRRHDVVLTDPGRTALFEAGDPRVAEEMSIRGLTPAQVDALREVLAAMMQARRGDDPEPAPHAGRGAPPDPSPGRPGG